MEEIHYLAYDPEEMMREMQMAYMKAGGDVLYPGDEKEMLLRAVQAVMTQAFAGVDNALRMDTLRYAVGEYLDIYGEKRGCLRNQAKEARATVEIAFKASGVVRTIPEGAALTADGEHIYLLKESVTQSGMMQTVRADIVAQSAGSAGNGLLAGTQMQFMTPQADVQSVYCVEDAKGGQEKEEDETYRERIRRYGLSNTTTGPKAQYESAAMSVSSGILDARALNLGAGEVGVYLLLEKEEGEAAILESVSQALNARNTRPLTDSVSVTCAEPVTYELNVQYAQEAGSNLSQEAAEAAAQYQSWQDETIGRAFNPDRLMAALYQAGAIRVVWGEGSHFNGGNVEYTEITESAHCKGTIRLTVMDA